MGTRGSAERPQNRERKKMDKAQNYIAAIAMEDEASNHRSYRVVQLTTEIMYYVQKVLRNACGMILAIMIGRTIVYVHCV